MVVPERQSELLQLIRQHGPLSRQELHQHTGLRPNTVGELAGELIRRGLLRERDGTSSGPGRPRQPLEIDADQRRVIGLAFKPGRVSACELNLLGRRIGPQLEQATRSTSELVEAACGFLKSLKSEQTIAIGISATGFVDPEARMILTSSATFRQSRTSLAPVYETAGECPVILENDMHALAAHWLLGLNEPMAEDVLLIQIGDGAIGAALLVSGKPNRGCISGGNELGHMRFAIETERCYCGQTGCLERICSSAFVRKQSGNAEANLAEMLTRFDPGDGPAAMVVSHLATGIANAINFIRPNRVVLTGALVGRPEFSNHLLGAVRGALLAPLADRVRIDMWDRPGITPAEAAAWLALAEIYCGGWSPETEAVPGRGRRRV